MLPVFEPKKGSPSHAFGSVGAPVLAGTHEPAQLAADNKLVADGTTGGAYGLCV